jgi:hypothetical protein
MELSAFGKAGQSDYSLTGRFIPGSFAVGLQGRPRS